MRQGVQFLPLQKKNESQGIFFFPSWLGVVGHKRAFSPLRLGIQYSYLTLTSFAKLLSYPITPIIINNGTIGTYVILDLSFFFCQNTTFRIYSDVFFPVSPRPTDPPRQFHHHEFLLVLTAQVYAARQKPHLPLDDLKERLEPLRTSPAQRISCLPRDPGLCVAG